MRARLSTPYGRFAVAAAALLALVGGGLVVTTRYACGCAPPALEAARWPAVTGATTVGSTLSTDNGTWVSSGDLAPYPNASHAYQWLTCTNNTSLASCSHATGSGATSTTYTIATADVGDYLRVRVTANNAGGSTSQASVTTAVVTGGGSKPTDFSASTILTGPGASGSCCGYGGFGSYNARGVVSGGNIFLGLLTSWSSGGNPDVESVYMSSDNGAHWTDLVDVGGNDSFAPSLIVDSHGDVYAFMTSNSTGCSGTCPSGSFTAPGTRMYMFPAGNFSKVSYLTLSNNPHCGCTAGWDKVGSGYDPGVGGTYGRAYFIGGDNPATPVWAIDLKSTTSASSDTIATAYSTAKLNSVDTGDQELPDYPHYVVARDGTGDQVMAWTSLGCGSLTGVAAGNCYSSTIDYVNDRLIYSTDHGSTWHGYCSGSWQQIGTANCGPNFSTANGSSGGFTYETTAYSILGASEICTSPCSTNAYHWMGATWLQDGWFLATFGANGGPLRLRRFNLNTQTQATEQGGANGVCSSDPSPICIDQIGGSGGDLFSGSGGANARIFLTGVDSSNHVGTIYSDDDGATWHNFVQSSSTYSPTYSLSGSAQLSNGAIFGAWAEAAQGGTSITFFHTN